MLKLTRVLVVNGKNGNGKNGNGKLANGKLGKQ